jgi:hypothetical protein
MAPNLLRDKHQQMVVYCASSTCEASEHAARECYTTTQGGVKLNPQSNSVAGRRGSLGSGRDLLLPPTSVELMLLFQQGVSVPGKSIPISQVEGWQLSYGEGKRLQVNASIRSPGVLPVPHRLFRKRK